MLSKFLTDSNVFVFVMKPLVNFITDVKDIMFFAEVSNKFDFLLGEHLSRWIVGRVDDNAFRFLVESITQFFFVENKIF